MSIPLRERMGIPETTAPTVTIRPSPDFARVEIPAPRLRALIVRKTPLREALRQLRMTHVASLVWACYRARVEWPGLPTAVNDPRVEVIQAALDRHGPGLDRLQAAQEAPAQPPAPVTAPAPQPVASVAEEPTEKRPREVRRMAIRTRSTSPIDRQELTAMVNAEWAPANVCLHFGVTAKQLAAYCKNHRVRFPGVPTPSANAALAAIQREIDHMRDTIDRPTPSLPDGHPYREPDPVVPAVADPTPAASKVPTDPPAQTARTNVPPADDERSGGEPESMDASGLSTAENAAESGSADEDMGRDRQAAAEASAGLGESARQVAAALAAAASDAAQDCEDETGDNVTPLCSSSEAASEADFVKQSGRIDLPPLDSDAWDRITPTISRPAAEPEVRVSHAGLAINAAAWAATGRAERVEPRILRTGARRLLVLVPAAAGQGWAWTSHGTTEHAGADCRSRALASALRARSVPVGSYRVRVQERALIIELPSAESGAERERGA